MKLKKYVIHALMIQFVEKAKFARNCEMYIQIDVAIKGFAKHKTKLEVRLSDLIFINKCDST